MGIKQLLQYGAGEFGLTVGWSFLSGFIIFYMTGLGLSAGVVGTVVMVSRFADAVTDVFVGNRVDQTHTRFGKARPWILGGALPVT